MYEQRLAAEALVAFEILGLGHYDLTVTFPGEDSDGGDTKVLAEIIPSPGGATLRLFPAFRTLNQLERAAVLAHEAMHIHIRPLEMMARRFVEYVPGGPDGIAGTMLDDCVESTAESLERAIGHSVALAILAELGSSPHEVPEQSALLPTAG